jgi:PAS domain S-box-containing protein
MVWKFSFFIKLLIGFVTAIIIITIIHIVGISTIGSMNGANRWIGHTRDVIALTQNTILSVTETDDYAARYQGSSEPDLLKSYQAATDSALSMVQRLRLLVSDNVEQVRKVDSLTKYVHLELELTRRTIDRPHAQASAYWSNHEATETNTIMQNCRQIRNLIITDEYKLLAERRQTSHEKIEKANLIMVSSTVIVVLVLLVLFIFIIKTFIANQKLKDQLQFSESIFSGVFNYSGVGMATVSLKGQWTNVNPYLLQLLGYTEEELFGLTFQDITHPDDLEADLSLIDRLLDGTNDTYKLEKRYYHKEGYIIWAILTVSIVRKEDGQPRFFVSQIEDISATKELIEKLELKNELLSETSTELETKVRQLEDFNGMVAHNLRGPAGSIEMMLGMVMEEQDAKEKEKMLSLIYDSSRSLNITLKDLMEILEIRMNQSIEYADCNFNEVTKKISAMLQGEILRTKATIITNFDQPSIKFPKVYLESVFYNMVSNSLKYKRTDKPVTMQISSVEENGKVKLTFADNGLGINLERHGKQMFKLNKVFHQGYDSKGVGLFITKNQLEAHGGSIKVDSKPGTGCIFTVHIPVI